MLCTSWAYDGREKVIFVKVRANQQVNIYVVASVGFLMFLPDDELACR